TLMLYAIFFIFLLQLVGEFLQKYFVLAIPGPVIGLLLMLVVLLLQRGSRDSDTDFGQKVINTSNHLLQYLSLLFVPIGVGVVMHLQLLESQLVKVLGVIIIGTLLTIIVTAALFQVLRKRGVDD
ncbi:MAG: CidA/LrgA family protein, partial [Betaproteobacteria bacterium]